MTPIRCKGCIHDLLSEFCHERGDNKGTLYHHDTLFNSGLECPDYSDKPVSVEDSEFGKWLLRELGGG